MSHKDLKAAIVPTVLDEQRAYDLYSRMLKDRIVFLTGGVDDQVAELIVSQFLFLESVNDQEPITFYINSPGGSVTAGMAIYDTMQFVKAPIQTICIGQACSMGAFLLSAGTKGMRAALPHSQIMIHQPLGGFSGQVSDVEIRADFLRHNKEVLTRRLAEHTGKTYEELLRDTDRDYWFTAEQALEYGLIDKIVPYRNSSLTTASVKELLTTDDFTPDAVEKRAKAKEQAKTDASKEATKPAAKAKSESTTKATAKKATSKKAESKAESAENVEKAPAKKSTKSTAKSTTKASKTNSTESAPKTTKTVKKSSTKSTSTPKDKK